MDNLQNTFMEALRCFRQESPARKVVSLTGLLVPAELMLALFSVKNTQRKKRHLACAVLAFLMNCVLTLLTGVIGVLIDNFCCLSSLSGLYRG